MKIVAAIHDFEHFVGSVLQCDMQMLRHPGFIEKFLELFGNLDRFQRTDAYAPHTPYAAHPFQKFRDRASPIYPVTSYIGSGQDELPEAVGRQTADLLQYLLFVETPRPSAYIGNDAVAASEIAPFLNFDEGAGLSYELFDDGRVDMLEIADFIETIVGFQKFCNLLLFAVAEDTVDLATCIE